VGFCRWEKPTVNHRTIDRGYPLSPGERVAEGRVRGSVSARLKSCPDAPNSAACQAGRYSCLMAAVSLGAIWVFMLSFGSAETSSGVISRTENFQAFHSTT